MKFTIPRNLDLEKLILSQDTIELTKRTTVDGKRVFKPVLVKTKSLLKHLPYCYYLINLIIKKNQQHKNGDGYVRLRKELIDKVIPNNTRILITNLLKHINVILVDDCYVITDYSKSYRITDAYPLDDLITIDIVSTIKGRQVIEPLLSINNRDTGTGSCGYVSSFLKRVNIVEKGVKKVMDEKTQDLINKHIEYRFQQDQVYGSINLDYDDIIDDGLLNELSPLIEKINSGNTDLTINVNNKVNRVFSPITSLKKDYRKYLRCRNGYSLMAIDFKTSHLFHLLKMIVDCGANNEALLTEVERVKQLAMDDIYSLVADEYRKAFQKQLTREEAKELFITRFLYGMYPNRKLSAWVKSLFPLISKFVDESGRRQLSIELQRSESHLLNNRIMKRIALELDSSITVFGVFDSVLIDEGHFDPVFNIMVEESEKYFGYSVPLTTDDLISEKKVSELAIFS
ncbi:hypothetical protein WSM22_03590 [Cytophagales bacterium WSM2-2]|nr:hypothetical protein WSM22_03590 [Cytophagales bacterium WSM2-2]